VKMPTPKPRLKLTTCVSGVAQVGFQPFVGQSSRLPKIFTTMYWRFILMTSGRMVRISSPVAGKTAKDPPSVVDMVSPNGAKWNDTSKRTQPVRLHSPNTLTLEQKLTICPPQTSRLDVVYVTRVSRLNKPWINTS
jgi:hypothetical protein